MSVETSPAGTEYLIFVPNSYDGSTAYPLLLYLHGAQAMGPDISRSRTKGLPKAIRNNSFFQNIPMIIVAPHVKAAGPDNNFEWDVNMAQEVVQDVENDYNIDSDRKFGSGISLGAKGIWDYSLAFPNDLIGIAPISGNAPVDNICDLDGVAVWAFHGEDDGLINITGGGSRKGSKTVIDALNSCLQPPYLEAYLTSLQAKGHEGWDEIYDLSSGYNIYEWLLALKKNDASNYVPIVEIGESKTYLGSSQNLLITSFAFDPNGTIQSYNWDQIPGSAPALTFRDDTPNLSVTITQPGSYRFSLEVTDNESNTNSDTLDVEVVNSSSDPAITGLSLFNDATDQVIGPISNNDVINLNDHNVNQLDIIASTQNLNSRSSVRFSLNTNRNFRSESDNNNGSFYSLGGQFNSFRFPEIDDDDLLEDLEYLITATAYGDRFASGPTGVSHQVFVTFTTRPLPVQLVSFDGSINDGQVTLNWATSEEIGNSHFEVYEGVGNAKNLRKIGRVPKSNSEAAIKSYSYSTVVSHCENIYYQIKSVDFDGHVDYSDIINVQNDASTCKLNVFPHPVTQGFLNVTNMAPYTGSMLKVISLQGQTLREMPITSEGTGVRIDTRNLQTGMYFLQVGNLKPEKIFIINN